MTDKVQQLRVRVDQEEKAAFTRAASLSGLRLSAWVRASLREAAERRLMNVGAQPPWFDEGEETG